MRRENFSSTRRLFLESLAAALGLLDVSDPSASTSTGYGQALSPCPSDALHGGLQLGLVPLDDLEAPNVPFHRVVGAGLDARLFTDLSVLAPDALVTPTDRFFVRTTQPRAARSVSRWAVEIAGRVERPRVVSLDDLAAATKPMGIGLLECAGNARSGRFGLMSVARWDGVPMAQLFEAAAPRADASHVLVSGLDDPGPSMTSTPGASWIFPREELAAAGAFLATRMNGEPLPANHGAPVRLFVPGWYGCACIKWVNQIAFVDDRAPATTQMREFAARTHQRGAPTLARDYEPAIMDFAAMPVRIEKWRVDGRIRYNIVGVAWGGDAPPPRLLIRTSPREPWVPVNGCASLGAAPLRANWTIWAHLWEPSAPGRYYLVLQADRTSMRTRRLDLYFYTRTVRIDEV